MYTVFNHLTIIELTYSDDDNKLETVSQSITFSFKSHVSHL